MGKGWSCQEIFPKPRGAKRFGSCSGRRGRAFATLRFLLVFRLLAGSRPCPTHPGLMGKRARSRFLARRDAHLREILREGNAPGSPSPTRPGVPGRVRSDPIHRVEGRTAWWTGRRGWIDCFARDGTRVQRNGQKLQRNRRRINPCAGVGCGATRLARPARLSVIKEKSPRDLSVSGAGKYAVPSLRRFPAAQNRPGRVERRLRATARRW
jgi:hypothetical protein